MQCKMATIYALSSWYHRSQIIIKPRTAPRDALGDQVEPSGQAVARLRDLHLDNRSRGIEIFAPEFLADDGFRPFRKNCDVLIHDCPDRTARTSTYHENRRTRFPP